MSSALVGAGDAPVSPRPESSESEEDVECLYITSSDSSSVIDLTTNDAPPPQRRLSPAPSPAEDDDVVLVQLDTTATITSKKTRISLKCPLSLCRIEIPVVGDQCTHPFTPFDRASYLAWTRAAAPPKPCPVCRSSITNVSRLKLVSEFQELLNKAGASAEFVDVDDLPAIAVDDLKPAPPPSPAKKPTLMDDVVIHMQPLPLSVREAKRVRRTENADTDAVRKRKIAEAECTYTELIGQWRSGALSNMTLRLHLGTTRAAQELNEIAVQRAMSLMDIRNEGYRNDRGDKWILLPLDHEDYYSSGEEWE